MKSKIKVILVAIFISITMIFSSACILFPSKPNDIALFDKGEVLAAGIDNRLKTLTVNTGSLSPSFNPDHYEYYITTTSNYIKYSATKMDNSNAYYLQNYAPQTKNLKMGDNVFYIKIANGIPDTAAATDIKTYTIHVKREEIKSNVNTLSSLSITNGKLSPSFNSSTTTYTSTVSNSVTSVTINASKTDSKSSFVDGQGPRTVKLSVGVNTFNVVVKSESGVVRTYILKITRKAASSTPSTNKPSSSNKPGGGTSSSSSSSSTDDGGDTPVTENPKLKNMITSSGELTFDPDNFFYTVKVDSNITNFQVQCEYNNETDTCTNTSLDTLNDGENTLAVVVTSKENLSSTYTITVIKSEEVKLNDNNYLNGLSIKDHEINFDPETYDYEITIDSKEEAVEINQSVPDDAQSTTRIEGNANLEKGSVIKIIVTAENGDERTYSITVTDINKVKSNNIVLKVILVIMVVLVLIYLILRLMGYRIYFNLSVLGAMFRSIGHKNKN